MVISGGLRELLKPVGSRCTRRPYAALQRNGELRQEIRNYSGPCAIGAGTSASLHIHQFEYYNVFDSYMCLPGNNPRGSRVCFIIVKPLRIFRHMHCDFSSFL